MNELLISDPKIVARTMLTDFDRMRDELMRSRRPRIVIVNNDPILWERIDKVSDAIFGYYPVRHAKAPAPLVYLVSVDDDSDSRPPVTTSDEWCEDVIGFSSNMMFVSNTGVGDHPLSLAPMVAAETACFLKGESYRYFSDFVPRGEKTNMDDRVHAVIFFATDLSDGCLSVGRLKSVQRAFKEMGEQGTKPFIFYPFDKPESSETSHKLRKAAVEAGGELYAYWNRDIGGIALRDGLTAVSLYSAGLPFLIRGMVKAGTVTSTAGVHLGNRLAERYHALEAKL